MCVCVQAFLVQAVARIRRDTALATDARVRLASEAIQVGNTIHFAAFAVLALYVPCP